MASLSAQPLGRQRTLIRRSLVRSFGAPSDHSGGSVLPFSCIPDGRPFFSLLSRCGALAHPPPTRAWINTRFLGAATSFPFVPVTRSITIRARTPLSLGPLGRSPSPNRSSESAYSSNSPSQPLQGSTQQITLPCSTEGSSPATLPGTHPHLPDHATMAPRTLYGAIPGVIGSLRVSSQTSSWPFADQCWDPLMSGMNASPLMHPCRPTHSNMIRWCDGKKLIEVRLFVFRPSLWS